MRTRQLRRSVVTGAGMLLVLLTPGAEAAPQDTRAQLRFEETRMIIEFNASAEDIGIQFFLDSDGWRSIEIEDPRGHRIYSADTGGSLLAQGGGTELFLESVEPTLKELSIAKFFERFPEGIYRFRGRTAEGERLTGRARFTHDVPAGPVVVAPVPDRGECATGVAIPAVIAWDEVTSSISGDPLKIVGYEVIVEGDEVNFDVLLPAAAGTMVTVPPELLEPGSDYIFEVLAIEASGNQTITEGCFRTAR